MNATKRKFNNLIQNIGTPRSSTTPQPPNDGLSSSSRPTTAEGEPLSALTRIPSSTSATAVPRPQTPTMTENMASGTTAMPMSAISADFLSKRRRVGTPGLTPGDANVIPSKMTITNITMRKWTPTGKGSEASRLDSPKYCPGDREQLIRRLGTFQELTQWTPKPDKVNEIEWAKRGWVCRGKETVQCTLCHKEAVVKMSKKEADGRETPVLGGSELEQALVKRFAELIIDAHQDDCLWRKRGCDGKFSLFSQPLSVHFSNTRISQTPFFAYKLPARRLRSPLCGSGTTSCVRDQPSCPTFSTCGSQNRYI